MSPAPTTLDAVEAALTACNPNTSRGEQRLTTSQYKQWRKNSQPDAPSLSNVLKEHGKWSSILANLGAATGAGSTRVTQDEALAVVIEALDATQPNVPRNEQTLTADEYKQWRNAHKPSAPSLSAVEKFGWNTLLALAGASVILSTRSRYTKADMDTAIASAVQDTGKQTLTVAQYDQWRAAQPEEHIPSADTIVSYAGTWNAAVIAAGATPNIHSYLTDDALIAAVREWDSQRDKSLAPVRNQYETWRDAQPNPNLYPSRNSMQLKGDTSSEAWENLLDAAGVGEASYAAAA